MRNTFLLFTLFLSTVLSCSRTVDKQLALSDVALQEDPKKALSILSDIPSDQLNTRGRRARFALLLSLAKDKSYIDVTDDSLVRVAVDYYKNKGQNKDLMLAMYSLSRIQQNAGNDAGAVVSLLEAKALSELEQDGHYQGLIYRNLADIYSKCHDYEQELYYYKESAKAFKGVGETRYESFSQQGIARSYMSLGMEEKADSVLRDLEYHAREKNDNTLLKSVLKYLAINEMTPAINNPALAISHYREARSVGYKINSTVDYSTMALAFSRIGEPDSSRLYIKKAEISAVTLLDSTHLFNNLARISNDKHDFESANEYFKRGVELHNKLIFRRENNLVANAIIDYRAQEAAFQHSLAKFRLYLIITLVVLLLSLCVILILFAGIKKRQIAEKNRLLLEKEEKIEEDLVLIDEITNNLQTAQNDCSELSRSVNSAIKEKIAIVKLCADAYSSVKNNPKPNPKDPYRYLDEDYQYKKEEDMKALLQALDAVRKDASLFELLEDSVDRCRDGLMHSFRQRTASIRPGFTETDYRIVMLSFAGIPDRTIAFLLDMTCGAVRTRKTRCKEKLLSFDSDEMTRFIGAMGANSWLSESV